MARPTAPLFAFGARGQLGKAIVFSSWKGRDYVRQYLIPGNPRSLSQTETRSLFRWLQEVWKALPALAQTPWTAFAKGKPLTNRNAFTKANLGPMRGDTTLANFIFSGGAGGGPLPENVVASAAVDSISIAYDLPTAPVGWTINDVVAAVIADQDPQTEILYASIAADDMTATSPLVVPGLVTGTLYQGGIWLVWNKPDGSLGYSPEVSFSGTPT